MNKIAIISLLIAGFIGDGVAATRPTGRNVRGTTAASSATSSTATTAARSARSAKTAPVATTATGQKTVTRGRVATTTSATTQKPGVAARAATTQKVIGTGTKVAGAAKNVLVDEECRAKYEGCMDSFCMLDNETGGRCICSDKNADYDAILAEIEALDQQTYQMATVGVERIEMGDDADLVIANANAVAQSLENADGKKSARQALDLSMWDMEIDLDDGGDVFGAGAMSSLADKEGDALHRAAAEICLARIPECERDLAMLQMMYAQQIKSDCAAYENSLKQQKNSSQQKLNAAERALREAALDQLRIANKYDLGQCTVEFKKCMQTTAGCGTDFASCATVMAIDTTTAGKKKSKDYKIKGAVTDITISASTYDTLIAKKPLCDTITKSCVNVADKVWDAFLKEVAPQIKSAELIAEDNARQNCIGNISQCFQKACKDNIDPNDPDGSYDMCLTRPASMLNLCKVPLNACGIDASSEAKAAESDIWDFVVARLASMRVDSCTTEVKNCLQSEDRCGKDYTKCVGLDLAALEEMCPLEKLLSCQQKVDSETGVEYTSSWDDIASIVQGIWLGIDDAMLDQCNALVNEKMIELCGDTQTCAAFEDDKVIGTDSLLSYSDSDGNYIIEGLVSFGNVKVEKVKSSDEDVKFGKYEININDYKSHLDDLDPITARVVSALQSTANKINQKIAILSQDPKIKMCVEGRDMSNIRGRESLTNARYPYLLDSSILAIISSGLEQANKNYTKKYNELLGAAMESKNDSVKAILCASMASSSLPECVSYITVDGEAICAEYQSRSYESIFKDSENVGISGDDVYSTKYVLSGAKLSDVATEQQKGHSDFTQTDEKGNMIGKIAMAAVYSSDSNTCTITTTTAIKM